MSDSLWPCGHQHARLPCPSPAPGIYSNSCPLNWWCHPTISSNVIPFSSHLQSFLASFDFLQPKDCSTPGFLVFHHLPEFAQTHVYWIIDAIQPSHSLSPLLSPPSVFPRIKVFSIELVLYIRWAKYQSFNLSSSTFNEYSELTSFRIDWLDLLEVQGTLKSLLQYHNSKESILLSFVYGSILISVYDYWKNHSFD